MASLFLYPFCTSSCKNTPFFTFSHFFFQNPKKKKKKHYIFATCSERSMTYFAQFTLLNCDLKKRKMSINYYPMELYVLSASFP